ncbi:adenylylsulfate kinase [Candidatus Pelagibacter sp. IMCC9063]|uniref:adenylyl-sulfate kinase n=1 Tax=Pelagibacter sp. (strain IMCC9063) TaxID=1002672 RepID=UPI0002046536|nr:adenylyl-sulfate kinase [Candidatus Pelagibacter sp. IMCC9063]AEA80603.1 adenylylsulfate kinase [Candidatus Pelagibacter sp. IMCC9063]|tara:strand:- start:101 stop:589 length:489 start_codon:yes stop_codon:yes gene_type:complete
MVIWIVGLAGSGKTTLAKGIIKKYNKNKIVHIDGDKFRGLFDNDLGHSLKDRARNARRISKFVGFLSKQKINIVVSVLSNFPFWLKWNRKNIKNYFEIFIDINKELLFKKNKKKLYNSKKRNVVGKDIKFNIPKNYDIKFKNTFKKKDIVNFLKSLNVKFID